MCFKVSVSMKSPKRGYQPVRSSNELQTAGNTRGLRGRDVQTDDHATAGNLYEAVRSGRSALPVSQRYLIRVQCVWTLL